MTKARPANTVLALALLVYVIVSVSAFHALLIVVLSVLGTGVFRDQEQWIMRCFGFFARILNHARPTKGASGPGIVPRSEIIKVCASLDRYPRYMNAILKRKKQLYFMLTEPQRQAAITTYRRLKEVERLSDINARFLGMIRDHTMYTYGINKYELHSAKKVSTYTAVELIEHFVRDWAENPTNVSSRELLYSAFIPHLANRKRILVPGSGLGRLAADISATYPESEVDALELSPGMLLGSQFLMSQNAHPEGHTVFPHLDQFSHWRHGVDQLEGAQLSLKAIGTPHFKYQNFLTLNPAQPYDGIATLFFIDTAQNIFEYIDKIHALLAKDGVWCNYGPLKWGTAAFAELSMDELLEYMRFSGWKIVKLIEGGVNRYNGSPNSMLDTQYRLVGWIAKKSST